MRQDQFEALLDRSEQLIDRFLEESNPECWPGQGLAVSQMDKQTRGDLYWVKKNAVATLSCAQRIMGLVDVIRQRTAVPVNPEDPAAVTESTDDLDAEIAQAEAEAKRVLDQAQKTAKKKEFDKRVHGKA